MSKIAVRLALVLTTIIVSAWLFISVLDLIPAKQRYPIARSDAPDASTTAPDLSAVPEGVAENVILIIADGMGPSYIEAARLTSVGLHGQLEMEKLPLWRMVSTRSADNLVTDSAAAATAIATGVKTNNRMVSVDPEGKALRTILEASESAGFVTGLVTTTDVSDATPAAFGTHFKSRYEGDAIASALVESDIDILMGSNAKHFLPLSQRGGRRTDGRDLLAEATSSGTTVARSLGALRAASGLPVVGMFEENERPPLPDLTLESLRLLEASGKRFFLMVESEEVDSAAHENDLGRTLSAVREIDQAVKIAVDWAARDGTTLVIVTSDHDTAGMHIIPSDSPKLLQVVWPTRAHTAQDVALFASGPGADAFAGLRDNTEIAPIMARVLGIENEFR